MTAGQGGAATKNRTQFGVDERIKRKEFGVDAMKRKESNSFCFVLFILETNITKNKIPQIKTLLEIPTLVYPNIKSVFKGLDYPRKQS